MWLIENLPMLEGIKTALRTWRISGHRIKSHCYGNKYKLTKNQLKSLCFFGLLFAVLCVKDGFTMFQRTFSSETGCERTHGASEKKIKNSEHSTDMLIQLKRIWFFVLFHWNLQAAICLLTCSELDWMHHPIKS